MSVNLAAENESDRIAAVRRYRVLDTPPEPAFDRLTALTARVLDVPIAAVTIVDSARIWYKAWHGLDGDAVERDASLCATTVLRDEPWVVPDARADRRSATNPMVVGPPGIRLYAGAPLKVADGINVGTLCVADVRPRALSAEDIGCLVDLASLVVDELELRLLRSGASADPDSDDLGIRWEAPPPSKARTVDDWETILSAVGNRPGVWAKIAHYAGETSAYRAAGQLRARGDFPSGDWEFAARRGETGSDLFARRNNR